MAVGQATLVIMLSSPRYSLRLVHYRLAINDWVVRARYWWLLLERGQRVCRAVIALVAIVLTLALWQSIESPPPSMETRHESVDAQHQSREIHCLALNVYHEARGEPKAGQYAVAEVTMNRVASKRFPDTVCDVVYEERWDRIRKRYVGAFSWTELATKPASEGKAWKLAMEVAEETYKESVESQVDGALFYHAKRIRPSWARKKARVGRVGRHIFYK